MSDHRGQPQRIGDRLFPCCPKTGKIVHATEQAARDHAAVLPATGAGRPVVFRCKDGPRACGGWHCGHRAKGAGKRGRRG